MECPAGGARPSVNGTFSVLGNHEPQRAVATLGDRHTPVPPASKPLLITPSRARGNRSSLRVAGVCGVHQSRAASRFVAWSCGLVSVVYRMLSDAVHARLARLGLAAMEIPAASETTDRLGNPLPASPTVDDIDRQAGQLRIVPEGALPPEALERIPLDELEQRRRRAIER